MSKSKKRRSNSATTNPQRVATPLAGKRSWLIWAGLAIVGVLAVVAVVAMLAWQDSRRAAPDTASGTPNLQVDQTDIDFGDVPLGKTVKASFKLSNTGDGTLNVIAPPVPEVVEGC